jgi:hypothetical protein
MAIIKKVNRKKSDKIDKNSNINLVMSLLLVMLQVVALERDSGRDGLCAVSENGQRLVHPVGLEAHRVRQLVRRQRQRMRDGATDQPRGENEDGPRRIAQHNRSVNLKHNHGGHERKHAEGKQKNKHHTSM